jgi:hypothetical protein
MSRMWSDSRCPVCKQPPKRNAKGTLLCACGKVWEREAGIKATETEAAVLAAKGFRLEHSINEDTYYVGPGDRLVWLYADGTFRINPRPENKNGTLEDYLEEASVWPKI